MGGPAIEGTYPHRPSVATLLRAPQDPVAVVQLSRRSASSSSLSRCLSFRGSASSLSRHRYCPWPMIYDLPRFGRP
jgi:hypothetical protein